MKKLFAATVIALMAFGMQIAIADDAKPASCEDQAVSKSGKKLSGAAKTAFIKKCEGGGATAAAPAASGCADKAVSKSGKKLAGAAKKAFLKKCEADAAATK
jgi:hypothetical protein